MATTIIGLTGYARSGKDSVANALIENHGFTRIAFADAIKEYCLRLNPWVEIPTYLPTSPYRLSEVIESLGEDKAKEIPEVRGTWQRAGNAARETFGKDFWIRMAMEKADAIPGPVVFTDVRHRNEGDAIRYFPQQRGHVWRVTRPGVVAANNHISEIDMDDYECDLTIVNSTTLEGLAKTVGKVVRLG